MKIMKQCIPQKNIFQQMTMLQYWVYWLILILIQSHHTWHGHIFNVAKLYSFFYCLITTPMFFLQCTMNIWAWRYNTNPCFKTDKFNFLENGIINHFVTGFINMYSCYLLISSIYFSYINIDWCNSFPKAWEEDKGKLTWQLWDLTI